MNWNLIFLSQVNWNPPAIYKSYCGIDVEFFPFDEQVHFDFDQSKTSHIFWNDVSTAFYILGVLDEVWLMDLWWVHGMIYNAIKFLFLSNNFPSSWTCGTWTSCRQTTASALPWTWGAILLHSPTSCCLSQRVCFHHACQGLLHLHWVGCDGGASAEEWEILSLLRGLIRNLY